MVEALLAAGIFIATVYGRMPVKLVWLVGTLLFATMWWLKGRFGHSHGELTDIDFYAQQSRLATVNTPFKCVCALLGIILVLITRSILVAGFVVISGYLLTVVAGRTPGSAYLRLMLTPVAFVLISGVALLFDYSKAAVGVLNIPFFGGCFSVTPQAQSNAVQVMTDAVAAVSCLYALSLSTPIGEMIAALRQFKIPDIIIELMYLIYRYIFVLSHTLTLLKIAANSRMGFKGAKMAIRSTGFIMSGLLLCSFRKASKAFDAMEARCYTGNLQFLQREHAVKVVHLLAVMGWLCAATLLFFAEKRWG